MYETSEIVGYRKRPWRLYKHWEWMFGGVAFLLSWIWPWSSPLYGMFVVANSAAFFCVWRWKPSHGLPVFFLDLATISFFLCGLLCPFIFFKELFFWAFLCVTFYRYTAIDAGIGSFLAGFAVLWFWPHAFFYFFLMGAFVAFICLFKDLVFSAKDPKKRENVPVLHAWLVLCAVYVAAQWGGEANNLTEGIRPIFLQTAFSVMGGVSMMIALKVMMQGNVFHTKGYGLLVLGAYWLAGQTPSCLTIVHFFLTYLVNELVLRQAARLKKVHRIPTSATSQEIAFWMLSSVPPGLLFMVQNIFLVQGLQQGLFLQPLAFFVACQCVTWKHIKIVNRYLGRTSVRVVLQ